MFARYTERRGQPTCHPALICTVHDLLKLAGIRTVPAG